MGYGGQRGTVYISITGAGCAGAGDGWEARLVAWLQDSIQYRITRVDLAYDDMSGREYGVDRALSDYCDGLYDSCGRPPTCEQLGNWIRPDGRGRTFCVGRRSSGKYLRVYEKGRQLGDVDSPWVN
jgi:phage replication initiation protein